ncbi:MAG: hypothetical protein ABR613_10285 [Actinomycetota bacterium]
MDSFDVTIFVKDSMGPPEGDLNRVAQVQLDAGSDSRIHDLAREAIRARKGSVEFYSLLFVSEPDQAGGRFLAPYLRAAVGADGRMYWRIGKGSNETTLADVVRTKQEGLFSGDPFAYSTDRGGYGEGGFVATWSELVALLTMIGSIGGGVDTVRDVAQWLRDLVQAHLPEWLKRHAKTPGAFYGPILDQRRWDAAQLARLLGVERDQAAKLLDALGYDLESGDVYRWSSNPTKARLRRKLMKHGFLWIPEDVDVDDEDFDDEWDGD